MRDLLGRRPLGEQVQRPGTCRRRLRGPRASPRIPQARAMAGGWPSIYSRGTLRPLDEDDLLDELVAHHAVDWPRGAGRRSRPCALGDGWSRLPRLLTSAACRSDPAKAAPGVSLRQAEARFDLAAMLRIGEYALRVLSRCAAASGEARAGPPRLFAHYLLFTGLGSLLRPAREIPPQSTATPRAGMRPQSSSNRCSMALGQAHHRRGVRPAVAALLGRGRPPPSTSAFREAGSRAIRCASLPAFGQPGTRRRASSPPDRESRPEEIKIESSAPPKRTTRARAAGRCSQLIAGLLQPARVWGSSRCGTSRASNSSSTRRTSGGRLALPPEIAPRSKRAMAHLRGKAARAAPGDSESRGVKRELARRGPPVWNSAQLHRASRVSSSWAFAATRRRRVPPRKLVRIEPGRPQLPAHAPRFPAARSPARGARGGTQIVLV